MIYIYHQPECIFFTEVMLLFESIEPIQHMTGSREMVLLSGEHFHSHPWVLEDVEVLLFGLFSLRRNHAEAGVSEINGSIQQPGSAYGHRFLLSRFLAAKY